MLQILDICKEYVTGNLHQQALDHISLNLRDSEFVAVLGPSGSGKTTLLNIIGGLDRYDSGDLIINGISTKEYKDRDWDSYRNHTIGFVFQSYNLIPHQTILANVELALTISGVSKSKRRQKAVYALKQVGLGDQIHKLPNQLSGGQMQRVAIARALVNDPDILLADEPTGALDSETSIQVMDLLKEVAKDRLVVMVTHNPELAENYATRIVNLKDGKITADSDPYIPEKMNQNELKHDNMGHSSMSFLTALSLSFNNLKTKKGRTFLTAFAGSIGIIGIALILSLSNGVNAYIEDLQKSTMASYPITIESESIDVSSLMQERRETVASENDEPDHENDAVYSNNDNLNRKVSSTASVYENNLTAFKKYLDNPDSEIHSYIGNNGIVYGYDTKFTVYSYDPDNTLVKTDGSTFKDESSSSGMNGITSLLSNSSDNNMEQLFDGNDGSLVSNALKENYDVLYGSWPSSYDEVVLVLDQNNEIDLETLYNLGFLEADEYKEILDEIDQGKDASLSEHKLDYEEMLNHIFYLVPACDMYIQNENGLFDAVSEDDENFPSILDQALTLHISGIIRPKEDADFTPIDQAVGYTSALTDYLIDHTDNSAVVQAQMASPDTNVLNGAAFSPADDSVKINDAKEYLARVSTEEKASLCRQMLSSMSTDQSQFTNSTDEQLAAMLDSYSAQFTDEQYLSIYNQYISPGSYDDNMEAFGYVNEDTPSSINIYVDTFEDKEAVTNCISDYNETASEDDQITYTDYVGLITSSVTEIINVITYVLVAFVAVSLIVSSIMIGIITYISVLERTKEIGILRAIGASKHNISEVFNAETFIIGLLSGLIGIVITLILLIPGNMVIHSVINTTELNASLPVTDALLLILLSVLLTLIGGFIPSRKAAKKDPVAALRTE